MHVCVCLVISCIYSALVNRTYFFPKVCGDEFPAYVLNSIDGYVEESHQSTVLDAISSFLTSKRYPPPRLLHTIMDILLVNLTACS